MIDDNGHKTTEQMAKENAFKGVVLRLGELQRQDGIITEAIDKSMSHSLGVIQTLITAKDDDADYRHILKLGRWKNQEHRDKFVKALAVCRITGAKMAAKTLLDQITADSAGDNGAIFHEAIEGLTHTTFTTQDTLDKKKKYDNNKSHSSSPIA